MGDPAITAGVGMGNMYINIFAMSIIMGMGQAISILVAQSFGKGDLYMCGVYLNRGRVLTFCTFSVSLFFIVLSR